jgi:hypothetical protein
LRSTLQGTIFRGLEARANDVFADDGGASFRARKINHLKMILYGRASPSFGRLRPGTTNFEVKPYFMDRFLNQTNAVLLGADA